MSRRSRRTSGEGRRGGVLERIMFSFMGPPQLGEDKAPEGFVADAAAELCHRCGQPWDAHGRVHTGTMTYRPCPDRRAPD